MSDTITILTSLGPLLTKRWTAERIEPYGNALNFSVESRPVAGIHQLSSVLTSLEGRPDTCVVRGEWDGTFNEKGHVYRRLEFFDETPRHWMLVDVDDFEPVLCDPVIEPAVAVAEFITSRLPQEFHGASHHWQLSCSAGKVGAETKLKAHVWFWLREARRSEELKCWAKRGTNCAADPAVFNTVQVHYTAAPIIDPGVPCPVVQRSGFVQGSHDEVDLAFDNAWLAEAARERKARGALADPRSKAGLIGAFCRVYDPHRVVEELIPEHFEYEGDSDHRLTWLTSNSGTPGGAFITDDELHIGTSHGTDPWDGHAANMWDVVRKLKFGELDEGVDDFLLMDMGTTPSHKAMREWAKELPEVQEELLNQLEPEPEPERAPIGDFDDLPAEAEGPAQDATPAAAPPEPSREEGLKRALKYIVSITSATDLETVAPARLRDIDLSDGEREQIALAMQAHYKALTGAGLPIATVRSWIAPAAPAGGFPDLSADGRVLGTHRNLEVLLAKLNTEVRYNVISKEDEIIVAGKSSVSDNSNNASVALLLSECNAVDMKINMGSLKAFVTLLGDRNPYNPALAWIESKPWDGIDRLPAWLSTVVCPNPYVKEIIMRRWALQGIAVLHNTGRTQARGILTFSGEQYAGKSRWLRSLAPEGLVHTGHLLDVHNKDSVKIALSYWITEFGELDGTFRRSDMAAFKAFASQEQDTQRRPYASSESIYPRRMNPAATVNESRFLQDPTGNTRFWSMAVTKIEPDHDVDMQQVWAQVLVLWEGGEQHWMTPEEMALLNQSNEEFTALDPLEEALRTKLDWDIPTEKRQLRTATEVLEFLGRLKPTRGDLSALGKAVRKITGPQDFRTKQGSRLLVPPLRPPEMADFG